MKSGKRVVDNVLHLTKLVLQAEIPQTKTVLRILFVEPAAILLPMEHSGLYTVQQGPWNTVTPRWVVVAKILLSLIAFTHYLGLRYLQ